MRRYKEDETRGGSVLDPRNYKGDSLIQAWVDRRKIATLLRWLEQGGYVVIHMSDILKIAIDELVAGLVSQGLVDEVELTKDANLLLDRFKASLNPGGRGLKNLHHNLLLDERRGRKRVDDIAIPAKQDCELDEIKKKTEEAVQAYMEMSMEPTIDCIIDEDVVSEDDLPIPYSRSEKDVKVDIDRNMILSQLNDDKLKGM
jgi:uncharacterized membrane-anchored protein